MRKKGERGSGGEGRGKREWREWREGVEGNLGRERMRGKLDEQKRRLTVDSSPIQKYISQSSSDISFHSV